MGDKTKWEKQLLKIDKSIVRALFQPVKLIDFHSMRKIVVNILIVYFDRINLVKKQNNAYSSNNWYEENK